MLQCFSTTNRQYRQRDVTTAVIGATGHVGRKIVGGLIARGEPVTA